MRQNWYFIFSESSVFRKRYIKFFGTREECVVNQNFWHLDNLVIAVLAEKDFEREGFIEKGYEELNIEKS